MAEQRDDKGQVYSIRLSGREMALLQAIAKREDIAVSEVVRAAIADYASARRYPVIDFDAPDGARVFIYAGAPATSHTRAPDESAQGLSTAGKPMVATVSGSLAP